MKANILGTPVDMLSLREAAGRIEEYIGQGVPRLVVTANPEIIMLARSDAGFGEILAKADMVTADGIGVVMAARILGVPLRERVTGIDLSRELFLAAARKGYRIYLLGAAPGVAEQAARNLAGEFPGIRIVGCHDGYFSDDGPVVADIKAKAPDILLAALGMGKQEKWVWRHKAELGVPVSIGVGGSLDVYAGIARRAPLWMQRLGLEWLYRLLRQPSRFWRMLALPYFLALVIADAIKQKLP
jgi:N-acetylglucosaminyldiphosphoundecaprenol N-acetyl-beta-D-mannosaminyltransferase